MNTGTKASIAMDWWRIDNPDPNDPPGDLKHSGTALTTVLGGRLAVFGDPGDPTKAACEQLPAADWSSTVAFDRLPVDSQLCMRTAGGRYARIIIRSLPSGADGSFTIAGVTWHA